MGMRPSARKLLRLLKDHVLSAWNAIVENGSSAVAAAFIVALVNRLSVIGSVPSFA